MKMNLGEHPNIVKIDSVYSWKEKENFKLAIVMEKCDDDLDIFLKEHIKNKKQIGTDLLKKWISQAILALLFMK